jgi:hypothetical protein
MDERTQGISDLLHEAGEVHHWQDLYADRIVGRFGG